MSREITPNWMLATRLREVEAERDRLREALERARHWHEQLDYDEALNVIDAALGLGPEGE